MSEFNLSEKREENSDEIMQDFALEEKEKYFYFQDDIKEFIRLLKKELNQSMAFNDIMAQIVIEKIDKLAGEQLKK